MKNLISLTCTITMLTACMSTEKLLEKGDYESLITKATRKLAGAKKKDTYVLAIESGFERWTQDNLAKIEDLKNNNTPLDWERIIHLSTRMDRIQNLISPLLPLVSETGYRAQFELVQTGDLILEARKTAASLYNTKLHTLTADAYNGNKPAAREAVDLIDRINGLSDDYDLTHLRYEMHDLGINTIWVVVEDRSYNRLPLHVKDELYDMPLYNYNTGWNKFYTEIGEHHAPDYKVIVRIEDLWTEPEEIKTVENNFFKDIQDGWEYVLDGKGNVIKDSLGNDLKKDRRIRVKATVLENIRTKRAFINSRIEVIDLKTGTISYSRTKKFDDCYTNRSRNYFGDERALDAHQLTRIRPTPCPNDTEMMLRVTALAKKFFLNELQRMEFL